MEMYVKKVNGKEYVYDKQQENILVNCLIKKKFDDFCKEKKIKKSKLIENFYKAIIMNNADGSLKNSGGFITVNVLHDISYKNNKYYFD